MAAELPFLLVDQKPSTCIIHHAADAPETAKLAARELRQTIQ